MTKKPTREDIEKCRAFFRPENLQTLDLSLDEVALLVIDVQKEYCDPAQRRGNQETVAVAERISSLVPAFRKAGIPVYAVYYSVSGKKPRDQIDFYKFSPANDDRLIAKDNDSAFKGSAISGLLKQNGKKKLLVCGFNLAACVSRTVQDAVKSGYEVCVLGDLTGDDNFNKMVPREKTFALLEGKGAQVVSAAAALKTLRA